MSTPQSPELVFPVHPTYVEEPLHGSMGPERRVWPLRIEFTGSGSEYFRIWIVNLLLTVVTLGLYFPWAKVRRMRYFYANTLVDSDPLHFHGKPFQIFKGYVVVILGFILYSAAGKFSPTAGLVAFLTYGAIWPALFRSSLCFRLANTSWRGLRFSFSGSTKDAYRAWLPLFVPTVCILSLYLVDPQLVDPKTRSLASWVETAMLTMAMGSSFVLSPWLFHRIKKYQHNNLQFSTESSYFSTEVAAYYGAMFVFVGLGAVALVGFGLLFLIAKFFTPLNLILSGSVFYVLLLLAFTSSFVTVFQNLVWNGTRSNTLSFTSTLKIEQMTSLSVKNFLLTLLTLGLYWPFAVMATNRLRLESVALESTEDPSHWVAVASWNQASAIGDVSGDFFGFDVGL